jgi:hypothetical protein
MTKRRILEVTTDMLPSAEEQKTDVKEEKKDKEENSQENNVPKYTEEAPDYAKEIIDNLTDEQRGNWKMAVDRLSPLYDRNGVKLKIGEVARYGIMPRDELEKLTRENFGGGFFAFRLLDSRSQIKSRLSFRIDGAPKATKDELDESECSNKPRGVEGDPIKDIEKEKKKLEATLDYEKTRKRVERQLKDLENDNGEKEDETTDDIDISRFDAMRHQSMFSDPREVEAKIRAQLLMENENRELKNKLAALESKLDVMQENQNQPKKSTSDDLIKTIVGLMPLILPIIEKFKPEKRDAIEDIKKVVDALGLNKQSGVDQSEMLKVGMTMLTSQMQTSQQMMLAQMQTTLETSMAIMKKTMLESSGTHEPEDWRLALGSKALDAGQTFIKEIVGFNKEKLSVENKKLDLMKQNRPKQLARVVEPKAEKISNQEQVVPTSVGEKKEEVEVEEPQMSESESELKARVGVETNTLLNSLVQGYISGKNPEQMVEETGNIVGDEVLDWLLSCNNLNDIKQLAAADGKSEMFDKYISGMPDVKIWAEKYLTQLKETYTVEEE